MSSGGPSLNGVEVRVAHVEAAVDRLEQRLDDLTAELAGLRADLAGLKAYIRISLAFTLAIVPAVVAIGRLID